MSEGFVGWAKAYRAVPTFKSTDEKVGMRRLSSGAHSRDLLALPTLQILGND
jgi:hypothetical protein